MKKNLKVYNQNTFESIKHCNENGQEFWFARELQTVLEYKEWRNFETVIKKAIAACQNSKMPVKDHFVDTNKMVLLGSNTERIIQDIKLTRYACYLIVQNANPRKPIVATGQTYFAVQTRKQEISEFENLSEDDRRLELRNSIKGFNKSLADAAHNAGVINYGKFQNSGYQGLYNGENAEDIKKRKNLKKSQNILDHMGATELAANYFRITQTEEKLKKDNVKGEGNACNTHYNVGKKVRNTMIEISGTAPEQLPTPTKSIKQIEREQKKQIEEK